MRRYGAGNRRINRGRFGLVIGVAAAAVVVIVLCVIFLGGAKLPEEEGQEEQASVEMMTGVFEPGISVGGVNVSGLTIEEGKAAVLQGISTMLNEEKIEFTVTSPAKHMGQEPVEVDDPDTGDEGESASDNGDETGEESGGTEEGAEGESGAENQNDGTQPQSYAFTLEQLGVTINPDPALIEAMNYSDQIQEERLNPQEPQEDGAALTTQTLSTEADKDFPLGEKEVDAQAIEDMVNELAEISGWDVAPTTSNFKVEKHADEDSMTTWGELVETDPVDGYRIKTEDIISTILEQVETGEYAPFDAPGEVVKADDTTAEKKTYVKMASASTSFAGNAPEGRRWNIFKISDSLNGVVLWPGEMFSVNDHVGPRNAENGWKEANGIEDGNLTPQYGGGICQVSTTLYNACLKAEMQIDSRVPHSIAAAYVKKGLDATISTGGPDFKFTNTLDDPMYIIIKCDGSNKEITAELWGTWDRDYYLTLDTEMISDPAEVAPLPEYVAGSGDPYELTEIRRGRRYEQWQVYANKYDKETDALIEEKIPVTTSTYNRIVPKYQVGSAMGVPAAGTPIEQVQALRDQAIAAAAVPVDPPPVEVVDPNVVVDPNQADPNQPVVDPNQPVVDPNAVPPAA